MTTHDKEKIIAAAKEVGCNAGYLGSFYSSTEALERLYAIAFESGRQAEREKQIQEVSNAKNKTN